MKHATLLAALLLVVSSSSPASAKSRSDFYAPLCAWNATHVVVAEKGDKIDGHFKVLESWKGDLKPGDRITIPELAELAPEEKRAIRELSIEMKPRTEKPTHVTFARVVLFLRRSELVVGSKAMRAEARTRENERWRTASSLLPEDIKVSVTWVEEGICYAFIQVSNPGDIFLVLVDDWWSKTDERRPLTEADLKKLTLHSAEVRKRFDEALTTEDPEKRAKAFAQLRESDLFAAKSAVSMHEELAKIVMKERDAEKREQPLDLLRPQRWDAVPDLVTVLRSFGQKSVPLYRDVLLCPGWGIDEHVPEVVSALVEARGAKCSADLVKLLGDELTFWKEKSPTLKPGWIDAPQDAASWDVHPWRTRTLLALLRGLQTIKCPDGEKLVTEIRDLWRSRKTLDDDVSLVSEFADLALASRGK